MTKGILLAGALILILWAHALIIERDLYNQIWWLDIVLHTVGGVWVALAVIGFLNTRSLAAILAFALLFGIGWEMLEFFLDVPFFGVGEANITNSIWMLDTLTDLMVDAGAALLVWMVARAYTKSNA